MFVSSVYHPARENAIRETGRRTGQRGKGGRPAWRISAQKRKKSRRGHNVRGGVVTQRGFEHRKGATKTVDFQWFFVNRKHESKHF